MQIITTSASFIQNFINKTSTHFMSKSKKFLWRVQVLDNKKVFIFPSNQTRTTGTDIKCCCSRYKNQFIYLCYHGLFSCFLRVVKALIFELDISFEHSNPYFYEHFFFWLVILILNTIIWKKSEMGVCPIEWISDWMVLCVGFNSPFRLYFSLYQTVSQRQGETGRNDR